MRGARDWVLGAALLGLAGCATVAADSPEACKFTKVGEVALTGHVLQPLVQMEIDGKPLTMLLDTGASSTVIVQSAFEREGLELNRAIVGQMNGIGGLKGMAPATYVRAQSVKVGGTETHYPRLYIAVGAFSLVSLNKTPIDGLLGQDILARYDIDLDLPHHRMAFYEPRRCADGAPPWGPATMVARPKGVPSESRSLGGVDDISFLNGDRKIYATLALDNHPVIGMLDTGASLLYLDRKVAERVGVTADDLTKDQGFAANGASASKVTSWVHKFGSMTFLEQTFNEQRIGVGEIGGATEMLAGMPLLQYRHIWIPVHGSRVYFGPATKPEPL